MAMKKAGKRSSFVINSFFKDSEKKRVPFLSKVVHKKGEGLDLPVYKVVECPLLGGATS